MKEKKTKRVMPLDLSEEETKKLYSGIKKIVHSNRKKAKSIKSQTRPGTIKSDI